MENYDPNRSYGKNVIEVTFQKWEYSKTITIERFGNCKGMGIIEGCEDEVRYEASDNGMILTAPDGRQLEVVPGDSDEDWRNAIVGVKIVSFEKESRS